MAVEQKHAKEHVLMVRGATPIVQSSKKHEPNRVTINHAAGTFKIAQTGAHAVYPVVRVLKVVPENAKTAHGAGNAALHGQSSDTLNVTLSHVQLKWKIVMTSDLVRKHVVVVLKLAKENARTDLGEMLVAQLQTNS